MKGFVKNHIVTYPTRHNKQNPQTYKNGDRNHGFPK